LTPPTTAEDRPRSRRGPRCADPMGTVAGGDGS
jgi:hypothetical protein